MITMDKNSNLYDNAYEALEIIRESFDLLMDEVHYSKDEENFKMCAEMFIQDLKQLDNKDRNSIIYFLTNKNDFYSNLVTGSNGYNPRPQLQIIKGLYLNDKIRQREPQTEIDRRINILRGKLIPLKERIREKNALKFDDFFNLNVKKDLRDHIQNIITGDETSFKNKGGCIVILEKEKILKDNNKRSAFIRAAYGSNFKQSFIESIKKGFPMSYRDNGELTPEGKILKSIITEIPQII